MKHKPNGLQHIGIPTDNFDGTLEFYRDLGFEVLALKRNMGGFHCAMIGLGNCVIEVYKALPEGSEDVSRRNDGRIDHIALSCDELEELYGECVDRGLRILSDGIEQTEIWENGGSYFIFEGPNHERIECARRN